MKDSELRRVRQSCETLPNWQSGRRVAIQIGAGITDSDASRIRHEQQLPLIAELLDLLRSQASGRL